MSKKEQAIHFAPNAEQSRILLQALNGLPDDQKRTVLYKNLYKDISSINTIWERRIKNEKIIRDKKKQNQPIKPPAKRWMST